ncbi:MAG: NAD-dependent epimerase/dehydratase family protein [Acidobacteriota bacterium]|nr:MAG: NAD-dependent epimerase/dehydratase family protein [Acidobacteriota bacterium]
MRVVKKRRIGITCIGTGVGQAVVNSCRISAMPLLTIGIGSMPLAYGNFDCDETAEVPDIYSKDYVDALEEVCREHGVELLIPTHDDETALLSRSAGLFENVGTRLLAAKPPLLELCRDKLFEDLPEEIKRHFVKSYTVEGFRSALGKGEVTLPAISKPRTGFASRGVRVVLDEDHLGRTPFGSVVQEIAFPRSSDPNRDEFDRVLVAGANPQISEISIQLVYRRDGELAGRIATENRLARGVPVQIVPLDINEIREPVDEISAYLERIGSRGPVNLQGRLTGDGLKLFELNARFTGISGIRAQMGFNEVEFCIADWLDIPNKPRKLSGTSSKIGVRQTADRVVPVTAITERSVVSGRDHKKIVLVTGGTGYLGRQVLALLREEDGIETWVFTRERNTTKLSGIASGSLVFDLDDLRSGRLRLGRVETLVHLGFARPFKGEAQIASSLRFTFELFDLAAAASIPRIINISSQSVYGFAPTPWQEADQPAPATPYGLAKIAAELHLESLKRANPRLASVSLRLCSVTGGAEGLVVNEVTSRLVARVLNGETMTIKGGDQLLDRIDVRDAASAILAVLNLPPDSVPEVLNVGTGTPVKLSYLASTVLDHGRKLGLVRDSRFILEPSGEELIQELCVEKLMNATEWRPQYTLADTVESLFEYLGDGVLDDRR